MEGWRWRGATSRLQLLLLFSCCGVFSAVRALRISVDQDASSAYKTASEDGLNSSEEGEFRFTIINSASVPLNILALPKLISLYGVSGNELAPGSNLSFTPGMAAYDFHVVINDGNNTWNHRGEANWGLTKKGAEYAVGLATAASATSVAYGATVFVSAALASVVAPPVLAGIALATFWGSTVLSNMAVSALTSKAMDDVRDFMKKLHDDRYGLEDLQAVAGLAGKPPGHPDRLLRLTDVVKDQTVLSTLSTVYPDVDVENMVMTRRQAEAYYTGMLADFKSWAVASGFNKKWVIKGGFTPPTPLKPTKWMRTTFEPLQIGEIKRKNAGLCQKSLVISYETRAGTKGKKVVQSDWDSVLVVEKTVPGEAADQECRKRYTAMCAESILRIAKECRLKGLQNMGVTNELIWDTADVEDKSLKWFTQHISRKVGEGLLRVPIADDVESSVEFWGVSVTYATPK